MTTTKSDSAGAPNSNGVPGLRRRAREMAVQMLFQLEFVPGGFQPGGAPHILRRFIADFAIDPEISEYGSLLFTGVTEKMKEIDAVIQSNSAHWKISRMGLVDLSVMRVAVFEMKFLNPSLEPKIAINEAVEIAKRYGSTESGAFVNGILDNMARAL